MTVARRPAIGFHRLATARLPFHPVCPSGHDRPAPTRSRGTVPVSGDQASGDRISGTVRQHCAACADSFRRQRRSQSKPRAWVGQQAPVPLRSSARTYRTALRPHGPTGTHADHRPAAVRSQLLQIGVIPTAEIVDSSNDLGGWYRAPGCPGEAPAAARRTKTRATVILYGRWYESPVGRRPAKSSDGKMRHLKVVSCGARRGSRTPTPSRLRILSPLRLPFRQAGNPQPIYSTQTASPPTTLTPRAVWREYAPAADHARAAAPQKPT
jgi:hypothetical protein